MGAASPKLNPYERILFVTAMVVGGLLVVIRLGMMASIWYLHHAR
jgi:hypothetical protein